MSGDQGHYDSCASCRKNVTVGYAESLPSPIRSPPLEDYNPATSPVLTEALIREGGDLGSRRGHRTRRALGQPARCPALGGLADRHRPVLRTHDRYGHRIDEVEFHPAARPDARRGRLRPARRPWTARRADPTWCAPRRSRCGGRRGPRCPISMTYAAVPALRHAPELARQYEPLLTS